MDDQRRVASAAGRMSVATFLSRILGYVRDMLFGALFGAGNVMDAFLVAFRIPNLFREIFAEGSMSAAFVPVLTEITKKEGDAAAVRLVRITFTFLITIVGGLCAAGVVFAPAIVTLIAPGFLDDPEKFRTTVLLARIMFPFLLFVSLAAMAMGALNTKGVFFLPALAPAMLNVVSITIVLLLVSRVAPPIMAVAISTAIGGLAQFAMQIPSFLRKGYSLRPLFRFREPGLVKMFLLAGPVILSMSTNQVNIFVTNILASYLAEGSITCLYYAMRLIHLPIGVFGVAMAVAVLPTLSRQAVDGDIDKLRDTFSFALRLLFFITLPAMAGLMALNLPIVSTLFRYGRFGAEGVTGTASALFFYALGIWSMVGMRVAASTFYSMQDSKTPVRIAMIGLASNALLSLALMQPFGHSGLALANSLSSGIQFVLLLYFLRAKIGRIDGRRILQSFARSAAIAAAVVLAVKAALPSDLWLSPEASGTTRGLVLALAIFGAAAGYLLLSRIARSEELTYLLQFRHSSRQGGSSHAT